MAQRKISCRVLLIGGSAGSLDVLLHVLPYLDKFLPFPVVIIIHRKYSEVSTLSKLLSSKTELIVKEPEDKEQLLPGIIYLAPADYHLLLEQTGVVSLDYSEKVNYSRPSIDVTFESAADIYQSSAVGILLSGANSDGVAGLMAIRKQGGYALVQDPATAQTPYMPEQAIKNGHYDETASPEKMVGFINGLCK